MPLYEALGRLLNLFGLLFPYLFKMEIIMLAEFMKIRDKVYVWHEYMLDCFHCGIFPFSFTLR